MKHWILLLALLAGLPVIAATSFSGRFVAMPNWTHQKTTGSSTLAESFGSLFDWTHTSGTNASQMSTLVVEAGTLTNAQSVTFDLANAVNGFGDSVTFKTVRFLAVKAGTANTSAIRIGGDTANRFGSWGGGTNDTINIRPGGFLMLIAPDATGYAVGTNGNLVVSNTGTNSATYELYVGGAQ
jgi:hypothetical protein